MKIDNLTCFRGVLLQRQNRLTEAVDVYKKAIHFRPKLVLAHLNLGMAYDALGYRKEGLRILQSMDSIPDDGLKDPRTHQQAQTSALCNSGKILLEMGYPSDAMENLPEPTMISSRYINKKEAHSYPAICHLYRPF